MGTHTTVLAARKAAALTLEALAAKSGVGTSTISRIERGDITNPLHNTVVALEWALGLSAGALTFGRPVRRARRLASRVASAVSPESRSAR